MRAAPDLLDGRRHPLRLSIDAGARVLGLARTGRHDGDAIHGAHARHRISSASRRTAYPRLSDDRVRPWGAHRGPLSRVAKLRPRTAPSNGVIHDRVRDWVGGFSQSRVLWLSLLLLPVVGGGMMVETAATNNILQTIVEEQMRGRVMSFYTMAFLGTAPLGSLIADVAADRIGAPTTILLGGIACVAAGRFGIAPGRTSPVSRWQQRAAGFETKGSGNRRYASLPQSFLTFSTQSCHLAA